MQSKEAVAIEKELSLLRRGFEIHIEDDKRQFQSIKDSIKINTDRIVTIDNNVQELLDIIKALSVGKQIILGTSIFLGSIIGIGVGLKAILGWFK